MSLTEALRFKGFASKLTDQEKRELILTLLDQQDDIIFRSLFHHFSNSSPARRTEARHTNQHIVDIIQKRKKIKKSESDKDKDVGLGDFTYTRDLISCIGAYLDPKSYHRFALCSRAFYVGCFNPNTLQELSLFYESQTRHTPVNLSLYPSLRHLFVNLADYASVSDLGYFPRPSLASNPKVLSLFGDEKRRDLSLFVYHYRSNFKDVHELHCQDFDRGFHQQLPKLLAILPSLQFLSLRNCTCTNVDKAAVKAALPRLKGLQLCDRDFDLVLDLLTFYAPNLEYAALFGCPTLETNISLLDLRALKEFQGYNMNTRTLSGVLVSAVNLTRMFVEFDRKTDPNEIRAMVVRFMMTCTALQELEFCRFPITDRHVESMFDGMADGLSQTKVCAQRKSLVLRISIGDYHLNVTRMTLQIVKIIQGLTMSRIEDWMFICKTNSDNKVNQVFLKHLEQALSSGTIVRRHAGECPREQLYVIHNEHCKINGYKQKWKMQQD